MEPVKQKLYRWLKILIGGPLGVLAWSVSGASAVAVLIWGIKTVAIPLLMLKTASWGIWGLGVIKESNRRTVTPFERDLLERAPLHPKQSDSAHDA
jgi:hypothetical protein